MTFDISQDIFARYTHLKKFNNKLIFSANAQKSDEVSNSLTFQEP